MARMAKVKIAKTDRITQRIIDCPPPFCPAEA
jgi:hypothetical protein